MQLHHYLSLCFFFFFLEQTVAQLTPNFSANTVEICAPGIVQFNDLSISTTAPIVQWEWKRDGNPFSTLENPSLFFSQPGVYDICLTITDSLGNIDSICIPNYITAYHSPTANLAVDTTSGCRPLNVHFSDLSILGDAPIQHWRWDFGDGTIDTIHPNPIHSYTTVGTFDVTLVVTDTNGCSSSFLSSNLISVSNNVSASIAHNAYQVQCGLPAAVTFNGISNGPNLNYTWYFDDNSTATGATITHQYLGTGCYSPTLVVSNGLCAAMATTNSCITISDAPIANFTLLDSTNCQVPFTINTQNQSIGHTSTRWDFGDGSQSNAYQPSHNYTSYIPSDTINNPDGVFPVILQVANAAGCTDQDTQYVYISNLQASITAQNLPCAPDTALYQAISQNISPAFQSVNWTWTVDHVLSSNNEFATAYYADSGIYQAQVIVTDNIGCIDTAQFSAKIGIVPSIYSITTDTNYVCRITTIDFNGIGSSYIDHWHWYFSDKSTGFGTSFQHHFQDTGAITGTVTASFRGCNTSINLDTFYIFPPIAKFSHTIDCDSFKAILTDESIAAHRWFWDFGDSTSSTDTSHLQHPTYTYSSIGNYIITLVVYNDSSNCVDTFRNIISITNPIANFSIRDSICAGDTIVPTNNSLNADAYQWTAYGSLPFTNNSHSPAFTYNHPGIYPISLSAFSANGCFDTIQQQIHVSGIDTSLSHLPLPACRPALVTFRDSSLGVLSTIIARQWGNNGTLPTTSQTYVFPGTEIMTLQVSNDWGCTFHLEDTVQVGGLFINFNTTRDICLGNTMTAVAITNSPANARAFKPYTYIWDFGDGNRDTSLSPIHYHQYSQAGLYDVCLHIIDSLGCMTSFCRPDWVEVHDPTVSFTADTFFSSCPPLEVNFSNLSLSGNQWTWHFGDGSVSNLEHPTHVYSTAGFYDVILEVVAFPGCSSIDTISQMIQITGPTGNFVLPSVNSCAPYTVQLVGSGSNIASYTWLFGNGDIQTNNSHAPNDTTHYTYTQAGAYVPILVIDDGMGCQIPIEQDTIFIQAPPTPAFAADSLGCQQDSIQYQLLSSMAANNSVEWFFEGGSPNYSTQFNPTVYYPDTGDFKVQLILWEDNCSDSLILPNYISIKPAPNAHFTIYQSDSCAPASLQFSDSSTSSQGYIQSWFWDLDNQQTAHSRDTTIYYHQADSLAIKLLVQNNFGCRDTIHSLLELYPSPILEAGTYPNLCAGDSLQLQASGTATSISWSSAAWISDSSIMNPITIVHQTQQYILRGYNQYGCLAIDSVEVQATPWIIVDAGDSVSICQGDSIALQASGNTSLYNWRQSNSLSCQYCASPMAFPDSSQLYYLSPDSNSLCSNIDSVWVLVHPLPLAQITADSSICLGDSLQLLATGGQSYVWSAGNNLSNLNIPNPIATPTISNTYTVIVTDSNSCQDSISLSIQLRDNSFLPISDQTICAGDSVVLNIHQGSNALWLGDSLSCHQCLQTIAFPVDSSTYIVHYYNQQDCPVEDSIQIQVLDLRMLQALSSDSICQGDSLMLQVIGHDNAPIEWRPNYALSSTTSLNPIAYPSTATTYTVRIQQGLCTAIDSLSIALHPPTTINSLDLNYCIGDSAQLSATGNAHSYQWSPTTALSNAHISTPMVYTAYDQQYQIIGTGTCNTDTAYATVWVHDYPMVQLDSSITALSGTTISLNSHAAPHHSFIWSPATDLSCSNCPDPSWQVQYNQTFYLTVSNQWGCTVNDSILINVLPSCTDDLLFVPNAFSPNQDGHNDILYLQSGVLQEVVLFQIYNRWGQLVFETRDMQQGWDGRFQGGDLSPDVFGYFAVFKCPSTGEEILKKGNITILR